MNKEETIIINDELFYRIPNGTSYDYAPIPKEFKPYFERLQQENKELKEDIDKLTSESTEWEDRYYRLQDKWDVSIIELENKNKELHNKINKLEDKIKQMDNRFKNGLCIDNYLGGRKTRKLFEEMYEILKDSDVDE